MEIVGLLQGAGSLTITLQCGGRFVAVGAALGIVWPVTQSSRQPVVRLATPQDRPRAVRTVVAAFANDPAFRFFFGSAESFGDHAAMFAGFLFDKRVGRAGVWVIEDGAALAMWDPPATEDLAAPAPAQVDLPPDVVERLDAYDDVVHGAFPAEPHWYLGVLATHPAYAGRGWGRIVLAAGVAQAMADGVPAFLETTNPGNVALYRHSGWEVTTQLRVRELDVWVMTHTGPREYAATTSP